MSEVPTSLLEAVAPPVDELPPVEQTAPEVKSDYWAAQESEDFAQALNERIDHYYMYLRSSGRMDLWTKVYEALYAGGRNLGAIGTTGDRGELTVLRVNHLRNIITHTVNLITAQRPAFDCKAANADYDSEVQCKLAQSVLDYDMRDKRLEDVARQCVQYAVDYGEAFGLKVWDTKAGEPWGTDPATGHPILTGALRYKAVLPWDLIREPQADPTDPLRWCAVRRWESKWDLMAKFPAAKDAIENAPSRAAAYARHPIIGWSRTTEAIMESDEVEVFEFYHRRTEGLPDGRRALIVGDAVVEDGPLPYRRMPVFPIRAGTQEAINFGYTVTFDLLPLQTAVDNLVSTIASNQAAFGVQSILVPKGHGISVSQLSKGLQALHFDPGLGPPVPLQLVKTAPETFQFLTMLVGFMETISAMSSVVRGDPQASLKSGSALAMVASQALQFTIDLQAAYVCWMEDIATAAVEDYQDFAELPQVALIAGKSARTHLKEWKGSDIAKVTRVLVDVGNTLSKTLAGRSEIATQLVQSGLVTDPRQYIEVLTTGRLEPVTEGAQSELLLIRGENEALSEGKSIPVADFDDHVLHIKEHKSVVASPAARLAEDGTVVQVVLDHVNEHLTALRQTDPLLLSILGIQPPPDTAGNVGEPPHPPGVPGPTEALPPGPPASGGASYMPPMPTMPQPPKNPATGQRVNAPVAAPTPPGARPAPTA